MSKARRTKPVATSVLTTAQEIIHGERQANYGHPSTNWETIAEFWSTYIRRTNPEIAQLAADNGLTLEVNATDAIQMMVLLKTSRLIASPDHMDSLVDQAGYAGLHERVLTGQ